MKTVNEFIIEQLKKDHELRHEYMRGVIQSLIDDDTRLVCLELRNLVNATMGFVKLGRALDKNPKSLMRMLSGTVTPNAGNLWMILNALLKYDRLTLTVIPEPVNDKAAGKRLARKKAVAATVRKPTKKSPNVT